MSTHDAWRVETLSDEGLVLQMAQELPASELMVALLGSKATARRVLAREQVRADGVAVRGQDRLVPGMTVELRFWRHDGAEAACVSAADGRVLTVVYQDPLMLAVDKPAGLLVHGDGTSAPTLTALVQAHVARQGSGASAQAVQRLDVETTGLVLFSLTEEFQPALDVQVAGHDMRKRYLAVIEGQLPGTDDPWRELTWPIGRDRHDARRMRTSASGKPALTQVRTLAREQGKSLLLVELATGRRHQIRVHLARAGHPLLGDALYGGAPHADGLMLHAWQERLVHPVTGELVELATAVPPRFTKLFPTLV